jgi:hypothetical protein
MPIAALAIPAAISAGTSIYGAVKKNKASKQAEQDLIEALMKAGGIATDTTNKVNPQIIDIAGEWGGKVQETGEYAARGAEDEADRGIAGINDAVTSGQGMLKPYSAAGTTALDALFRSLKQPQQFEYKADPGYQFRLAEGQKQISRMAAAHGAAGGGGTAKALAQYNSGLASQEYGSAWERWNAQNKGREAGLTTIAGMGERAGEFGAELGYRGATAGAGLGARAAEYGGNARMNAADWAGRSNISAVNKAADNTLDLGNFLANLQVNQGKTSAAGTIGRGDNWANLIASLGGTAASLPWGKWFPQKKSGGGGGIYDNGDYVGE